MCLEDRQYPSGFVGRLLTQAPNDVLGHGFKIETSLLVGNADDFGPDALRPPRFERGMQLGPARKGIVRGARKPACRCIPPVARRTVCDLEQQGIAQPAQLRAHADSFVVGMRHDDHYPFFERTPSRQNLEDCIGSLGHSAAVCAPSGANPPPARQ